MLLKPLIYLKISHEQKYWYDYAVPALVSVGVVTCRYVGVDINFAGGDGLIQQLNGLLGVLSGFYIASLAGIAGFQNENLDKTMSGDPPILKIKKNGNKYEKKLSRREYLRFLFGYLAFASIVLFIVGIITNIMYDEIFSAFGVEAAICAEIFISIGTFLYTFAVVNIIINTIIGIYYLADRMHR